MKNVNILIKPASGICNLNCKYCFYQSPVLNKNTNAQGFMKRDTAEQLIKRAYEYADTSVVFAFQGGEPTLCGLEFFRDFISLTKKYNENSIRTEFSLQTNGIVIDRKWAEFLAKNKILTGLSIDGPSRVHNKNRIDAVKQSSLKKVMETKRLFDEYDVEYNVLCVVNSETTQYPEQVYNYFKKNGIRYIQYIPCLDPEGEEPGLREFSLKPDDYEKFLKKTFDLWYEDFVSGSTTVVRTFDNYLAIILGYVPESCGMSGKCICQFVVEADGSIYPCDFYVSKENVIGNVESNKFEDILKCKNVSKFLDRGDEINEKCKMCEWYFLCRDGCRRYRNPSTNLNYYCTTFKNFFEYSYRRMMEIAVLLQKK